MEYISQIIVCLSTNLIYKFALRFPIERYNLKLEKEQRFTETMVLVGDMRFIFTIARILGCASHVVTEDNVQRRRPRDVFFTVSSMAVYLCTLVLLYIYVLMHQELDTKGLFFNFLRVFLIYLCFFVDYSFTTLWNWKIRAVLSQLRAFDRATKFHDASKQRKVRAICRVIVFLTLIYWSIVGYISCR